MGSVEGNHRCRHGDFTHPVWFKELQEKLEPAGNGLYRLDGMLRPSRFFPSCRAEVFFTLSAEISCIYRKWIARARCMRWCLPLFDAAYRINIALSKIGNLSSDAVDPRS
jgi:hypothetical protein